MGSRKTYEGAEKVYEAAALWVDRALRTDDSLFTPGVPIWSSRWLRELRERFLDRPDESSNSFLEKLERQLEGSPAEVYQLMGEALYFYFLIVSTKNSTNEQGVINKVIGWSPNPVAIPQNLVTCLVPGIANPGQMFHSARPYQVGFLIECAEQWRERESSERQRLVDDPWGFKDFLMRLNFRSKLLTRNPNRPRTQREAILHLVFPDTFEGIVSVEHKEIIAKKFADLVKEPTEDIDRQLQQIRPALESRFGAGDHFFYTPQLRGLWDDNYKPDLWEEFVKRARTYVDTGKLEIEEIGYKVAISRKLAEAREAVLAGRDNWAALLKSALNPNEANFISWRLISGLNKWCTEHSDDALSALKAIWAQDDSPVSERVRAFSDQFPREVASGAGSRMNVASGLLMALDVEQFPPFRITTFNNAYVRTGFDRPARGVDEAALYEHALGFLDQLIDEASQRGLALRHRLDAQSVVWAVVQDRDAVDSGDGGGPASDDVDGAPVDEVPLQFEPDLPALAEEVFMPVVFLEDIETLLKGQEAGHIPGAAGHGQDLRRAETGKMPRGIRAAGHACAVPPVLRVRGLRAGLSSGARWSMARPDSSCGTGRCCGPRSVQGKSLTQTTS